MKIERLNNLLKIGKMKIENLSRRFRKSRKKTIAVGLLVVLVLTFVVAVFLNLPEKVEAAWWDDTFGYRHRVSFTHNAALSNQSVTFTLDTGELIAGEGMQADCDDTRFTDANGKLLLFDLTGTCDASNTTYEIIFPSIVNGSNLFYVYYGSPTAANAEIDSTGYTALTPSGGDPSLTNPTTSGNQERSQGPVLYYSFDEGSDNTCSGGTNDTCNGGRGGNAADGANNNMTNPSTTSGWQTEDQCVSGKCLRFDGSNDFVNLGNSQVVDITTNAITLAAWIKPAATDSTRRIISAPTSETGGTEKYSLLLSSGELEFWIRPSPYANDFSVETAYTDTTNWHFVTGVYDGSTMSIYIDGKLAIESDPIGGTTGISSISNGNAQIGRYGPSFGQYFEGTIDEVKVYDYARTTTQIAADFANTSSSKGVSASLGNSNQKFLSEGLVAYWKMDETSWNNNCSAETALDSSGNGINGAACPNSTGPTGGAVGKFGNAGSFDGSNDYLDVSGGPSSLDGLTNFTVSSWIYVTAFPGGSNVGVIFERGGAGQEGFGLATYASDELTCAFYDGAESQLHYTPSANLSTSTWYHVICTMDDTNNVLKMYVNGAEVYSATETATPDGGGWGMAIGRSAGGDWNKYQGRIDDLRIYNRALSSSEVSQLYSWAPGPSAYYNFDEGSGTTALDSSGNGVSGTWAGNSPIHYSPGKFGRAAYFNGTDDEITIADSPSNSLYSFTMAFWIKTSDGDVYFTRKGSGADVIEMRLAFGVPTVSAKSGFAGLNDHFEFTYDSPADNEWHHLAVTYDITTTVGTWYIDGKLGDSTTASSPGNYGTGSSLMIGDSSAGSVHLIDDYKIYKYARTASQIVEDMNGGHPIGGSPIASQIGYWSLDEQFGQTAYDLGVGDNDGTLGASGSSSTDDPTWKTDNSSSCKINGCASFDGGDFINMGDVTDLEVTTSGFTITAWAKSSDWTDSGPEMILSKWTGDADGDYYLGVYQNKIRAGVFGNTNNQKFSNSVTSPTNGQWYHLAATWSGGSTDPVLIYLNGKLDYSIESNQTITSISTSNSGPSKIGARKTATEAFFNGQIDEVKYYNSALTASEIAIDMNGNSGIALGGVLGTQDNEGFGGNPPVAWWKLDEKTGSTGFDYSGNGYNLTAIGGPSWVSGKTGAAINLDGDSQYLRTSAAHGQALFGGQTELTTSFWYFVRDTSTYKMVLEYDQGNSGWSLESDAATLDFYVNNGVPINTTTLAIGKWYHIALLIDGTNQQVYVNGVLADSASFSDPISDVSSVFSIGARDSDTSLHTDGIIDDFKIYDYARSPAQIAWDYNRGAPVAHWEFDECQGTTAYDTAPKPNKSDSGHNGTIIPGSGTPPENTAVGSCNSGNNYEMWNDGTTGKRNSSLGFDGTDDYVDAGTESVFNATGSFSTGAWVYWNSMPSADDTVLRKVDASLDLYLIGIQDSATNLLFRLDIGGVQYKATYPKASLTAQTWYHVFGVFDDSADTISLYLNGRLVATTPTSSSSPTINDSNLYIGGRPSSADPLNGKIDEFRFYNYPLSASQIKNIYNNGAVFFGPATGSP